MSCKIHPVRRPVLGRLFYPKPYPKMKTLITFFVTYFVFLLTLDRLITGTWGGFILENLVLAGICTLVNYLLLDRLKK
jgi:hypothetical protein